MRNKFGVFQMKSLFWKERKILKELESPKLIHLSDNSSDRFFASSVTVRWVIVAQDLGKHFYRVPFNLNLNLKVPSTSFIHILFRYSDRTMSNVTILKIWKNVFHSSHSPHCLPVPMIETQDSGHRSLSLWVHNWDGGPLMWTEDSAGAPGQRAWMWPWWPGLYVKTHLCNVSVCHREVLTEA